MSAIHIYIYICMYIEVCTALPHPCKKNNKVRGVHQRTNEHGALEKGT